MWFDQHLLWAGIMDCARASRGIDGGGIGDTKGREQMASLAILPQVLMGWDGRPDVELG